MFFDGGNYTLELRRIVESKHTKLFDFEYDFYEPQFKCDFERKFIDHYYFDQIGFETVARFKHRLKSQLNLKMPYYRQLYKTELESEGLSFMLNKDLKETFLRTVDTEDKLVGSNTNNTENSSTSHNSSNNTLNSSSNSSTQKLENDIIRNEESRIADGVASVMLDDKYLTAVSTNHKASTGNETGESTTKQNNVSEDNNASLNSGSSQGSNTEDRTGKQVEKTELISQGNIGTTSSAELLSKWREVLINLDEIIIDDCRDLFMGIY